MKTRIMTLALIALTPLLDAQEPTGKVIPKPRPLVQLAVLLDTSGSMSGLINQARAQLWQVVNELVKARRDGQMPDLQIALYEYGKQTLPEASGFIRRILPLTHDLDKVSAQLFALHTNGGDEYCGAVIQRAVNELAWSPDPATLKIIYIAGNEPFTQGKVDFRLACKGAITKGIMVNTIHCGSAKEGLQGHWQEGALLADGAFLNIEHNHRSKGIVTPQDQRIAALGAKLYKTYVPYGSKGKLAKASQSAANSQAKKVGGPANWVNRVVVSSNPIYNNAHWDLVDAWKDKKVKLAELKDKDLPPALHKKTLAEKEAFLKDKLTLRKKLQLEINQLEKARVAFTTKQLAKESKTLGAAMILSIRKQAKAQKFEFK